MREDRGSVCADEVDGRSVWSGKYSGDFVAFCSAVCTFVSRLAVLERNVAIDCVSVCPSVRPSHAGNASNERPYDHAVLTIK